MTHPHIDEALQILADIGLPRAQRNERSALTLLALIDMRPNRAWKAAAAPLIGTTPIMDWISEHYGKTYAPNTRETIRRQTMHQFVQTNLALYNPDDLLRPVNSPRAVYQVSQDALALLRLYGTAAWDRALPRYLEQWKTLADRYAREREMNRVPVVIATGTSIHLSPGKHSELIRDIIEQFAPRFAPGSVLIYAGDTGEKMGYFDLDRLRTLGVIVDSHGKMPDVVLHYVDRNWLLLVESVTSHGPVDAKRREELLRLFASSSAGLVYVTAFPTRPVMARYLPEIAWETEVWVADASTHLIHFNGVRFLGPYEATKPRKGKMATNVEELQDGSSTQDVEDELTAKPGRPVVDRSIGRREGTLDFGKFPISAKMGPRYLMACTTTCKIIKIGAIQSKDDLPDISEAKGMYNRVLRHDRPDWEAVRHLLGEPDRAICHLAATWLAELRKLARDEMPLGPHLEQPIARGIATAMSRARNALSRAGFYPA